METEFYEINKLHKWIDAIQSNTMWSSPTCMLIFRYFEIVQMQNENNNVIVCFTLFANH